MSSGVVSKNLYDLLGNDIEDEDDVPKTPTKEVVKQPVTSKKRDEAPAAPADGGRGAFSRRGRGEGNDAAFKDRRAGRDSNRQKPTEDGAEPRGERRTRGEGRGGQRGGRARENDRHSANARTDSDKQVSQGWGGTKGDSEWKDEQAGEQIAESEAKAEDAWAPLPVDENAPKTEGGEPIVAAAEPEPEDNTKSYAEYMAERAKLDPVAALPEARAANEGTREDKKWASYKEITKEEEDEYFASTKKNNKAAKARKEKTVLEIDPRFVEPKNAGRGGDREGRGGRGRGSERRGGDRGDFRGRGRGGSEFRGGERRGGGFNAPRGGANGAAVNIADSSAFPSLGK